MNILYCGDGNIADGLIISVLSLTKHVAEPLHIYVLTLSMTYGGRQYTPVSDAVTDYLNGYVRERLADSFVQKIDATALFCAEMPTENLNTRFTPCCMLRLYADQIPALPDKLLYLDNDVICRRDCAPFYHTDMADWEIGGVLDYYGGWLFRRSVLRRDYLNSGVLLMNLEKIRQTGLFERCRKRCRDRKMFMPDQSALNKLSVAKKTLPRRYNEQRKLHGDTVFQHFTTSFRLFPWLHTVTVKPWQQDRMHEVLKLHEYDALLAEYMQIREALRKNETGEK